MAGCPPVTSQPQTVSNTFNTDSGEVGSPEFGVPSQLAPLSNVKQVHIQQVLHVLEGNLLSSNLTFNWCMSTTLSFNITHVL